MVEGQKKKKSGAESWLFRAMLALGLLLMDDFNHQSTNEIYSHFIIKRILLITIEMGGQKKKVLPDSVSSARKKP